MADDSMALLETLRKATADGDVDLLREGVRVLAQAIMEAEVSELTGLPHGERDPERRLTSRNGYRDRRWDTRVGSVELAIPRVRDGSYFPSLLEPRRRAERALLAVIQEAYVLGVSTRRVDDLVRTLGIASISRSEVSRICAALDAEVAAFRGRSLAGEAYPYLWLDATYLKVREGGRVVSMAALVATGVARSGERRILGLELSAGQRRGLGLARLHPGARRARPPRGPPGHQRRPRGAGQGRPGAAPGIGLAALPGALHAQCPGPRPALGTEHGRLGHPGRVRAARRGLRPGPVQPGDRHVRAAHAGRRPAARRRRARPPRPLHVPRAAPHAGSARPTRRSGSTRRSSAAPRSSASSPTAPQSSASWG